MIGKESNMGGSIYNSERPLVVQQTSNRMWRVWLLGQPAANALDIELNSIGNKYYVHDVVEGLTADLWCELEKGEGVFDRFEHALSFCRVTLQRATEAGNNYQEIRVRLNIHRDQKGGYKLIENVAGHNYEALRHFFEDIGYEVTEIEIGEVENV